MFKRMITFAAVAGLVLALAPVAEAATMQIGPGADLGGATTADIAGFERLNVARTDTLTLVAGTYDVLDFQLNVLNHNTGDAGAGTITPMLLTGEPSTYTTLWVGSAFDPTSLGQQTPATYTPGTQTFTLAATGTVYGGIFTGSNGSAIPALANGVGSTDHDGNGYTAPTGAGQTVSGISNPVLGRTYAFEINIDADAGDLFTPTGEVTTSNGNSSAVATDLLQTNLDSVTDTGFGPVGGFDPIGSEPVVRNGTATGTGGYTDDNTATVVVANGESVTYTLDTSANTAGYQIDQIDIFHGWCDDGRDDITDIDVAYSTVTAPGTFYDILLGGSSGDYAANYGRTSVVPTGANTFLATNVAAVKLTFDGIQNGYGGVSEIDVIGSPVPEPTTLALAAVGLLGLRRRRRRA